MHGYSQMLQSQMNQYQPNSIANMLGLMGNVMRCDCPNCLQERLQRAIDRGDTVCEASRRRWILKWRENNEGAGI